MPVFPIKWELPDHVVHDEEGRIINELKLNDEWTVICVLRKKQYQSLWVVDYIEIHRKNTAGELLVSGELSFEKNRSRIELYGLQQNLKFRISQLIKTGSSNTMICSNLYSWNILSHVYINGFLNISSANEKQRSILTNEEFKEKIELNPFEERLKNLERLLNRDSSKQRSSLTNEESKEKIQLNSFEELSKNLERLLNSNSSCLADVTLKCDNVSIKAHKNILSARSPVFAAMFAHPMKESLKNEVNITDMDVATLRALLMYLYSGKTSGVTASSAADLLFAANKYQLQDLKTVCLYVLKENESDENMCNILKLEDMHSENLKSFSGDYICNQSGEVSVSRGQSTQKLSKITIFILLAFFATLIAYFIKN